MAQKVTEDVFKRILQLREIGLTEAVIATRLGITARCVRYYLRAAKTGTVPYHPDQKVE